MVKCAKKEEEDAGAGSPTSPAPKPTPACTEVTVEFFDIQVTVKDSSQKKLCRAAPDKQIIHGISGKFTPRRLVALMGASGAGKSTLLNVLSRRVEGKGEVRYNDVKQTAKSARRWIAFIQQEDLFFGQLTVQEHIDYQADLRLPRNMPEHQRREIADSTIRMLGLAKCRHRRIGNVVLGEGRGISGGEQKRLTIASELLTSPSVLFADEPTTGLDSYIAASVVQSMRRLCNTGRTVICTIHQPSAKIFEFFDDLLLMSEGRMLYCGPRKASLEWFSSRLGHSCPPMVNPADFIINTVAMTDENREEKVPIINGWADLWTKEGNEFLSLWECGLKEESEAREVAKLRMTLYRQLGDETKVDEALGSFQRANTAREKSSTLDGEIFAEMDAAAVAIEIGEGTESHEDFKRIRLITQFWVMLKRCHNCNKRDKSILWTRTIQTFAVAVTYGFLFFRLSWTMADAISKMGAAFSVLLNQGLAASVSITQTFPEERPIIKREYEAGVINIVAYFFAKTMSDFPLQSIILPFSLHTSNITLRAKLTTDGGVDGAVLSIVWFMVGMNDDVTRWLIGALAMFLLAVCATSIGFFSSAVSPSTDVALSVNQLVMIPMILFAGFLVDLSEIGPFWYIFQYMSPFFHAFSAYIAAVFKDETIYLELSEEMFPTPPPGPPGAPPTAMPSPPPDQCIGDSCDLYQCEGLPYTVCVSGTDFLEDVFHITVDDYAFWFGMLAVLFIFYRGVAAFALWLNVWLNKNKI